jgi:hypothetical protein
MHHTYPGIETPPDDTIIWRYINLERLLALLQSSSLYLSRLDHLLDPWEGKWPFFLMVDFPNKGAMEEALARFAKEGAIKWYKGLPKSFFVSCWHENADQSAAFWDKYGNSGAVAIRSTIGRLKTCVNFPGVFHVGKVRYIDYEWTEGVDRSLAPVFLKRRSFEH